MEWNLNYETEMWIISPICKKFWLKWEEKVPLSYLYRWKFIEWIIWKKELAFLEQGRRVQRGESHSGKERQTSKRWRRGAGVAGKRRGDSDRERRRVRWQSGERGWEAEGWAAPLMPIWPGDVIKLTYWFLWIYECLFHELHFQSRGLFRALSFFPQMDQLCAHVILLPEEPTHTSPICGASPGRTDSHYEHINKLTFFSFFSLCTVCVCVPNPPFLPSFLLILAIVFSPPGVVVWVSPGGLWGAFSVSAVWSCRNPFYPV